MAFLITIIGLNQTGMNLGMALGAFPEKIFRVGSDRDSKRMKSARDVKAVDRTDGNLPAAVADSDLIILCEPLEETLKTLDTIGQDLNSHRYLFDFCSGKMAINNKVASINPEYAHHLNIHITINPKYLWEKSENLVTPKSDYFEGGLMYVAADKHASEEAVDLATTLAGMFKSKLLFGDPEELDGLIASAVSLPALTGALLMRTVSEQPGWREARKLTGRSFYQSIGMLDDQEEFAAAWLSNKENLRYWINQMSAKLDELDQILSTDDNVRLEQWYQQALQSSLTMTGQRIKGEWEQFEKPEEKPLNLADRLGRLVGFGKKKS
jgi:prephenate dehydrogenase